MNEHALEIRKKYLPEDTAALKIVQEHTENIYELVKSGDTSPMTAIATANALQMLRDSLTPEVLGNLRKLQGSTLGFLTDRDKGAKLGRGQYEAGTPYDNATLADVVIEAASKGARMIGNEVNIIKSKCYLTKNFYSRLLNDTIGRNSWFTSPDIPNITSVGAKCTGSCWWKDSAGEHLEKLEVFVRGYSDSTVDFYVGKWEARARRFIYERSTGNAAPDSGDSASGDIIDVTPESVEIKQEMAEEVASTPISKDEAKELLAEAASKGLTKEELGYITWTKFGYQNSTEIRKGDVPSIRKAIRAAIPGKVMKEEQ